MSGNENRPVSDHEAGGAFGELVRHVTAGRDGGGMLSTGSGSERKGEAVENSGNSGAKNGVGRMNTSGAVGFITSGALAVVHAGQSPQSSGAGWVFPVPGSPQHW